jgi:osmotically-inducible protein OsmY
MNASALKTLGLLSASALLLSGCISAAVTGVMEATHAVAEDRSVGTVVDDTGIYARINHLYLQEDVNDLLLNVNVMVRDGRVLLVGVVKEQATVDKAVQLAWRANGVREVINELVVRPEGYGVTRFQDEWVEKNVEARLTLTRGVNILNYTIEVVDGTVYLLGVVASQQELDNVLATTRRVRGVQKVVSHLRLSTTQRTPMPDNSSSFEQTPYRR